MAYQIERETPQQSDREPREHRAPQVSATGARQGEIVLGRRGIWIWVAAVTAVVALAVIVVLLLPTSFAGP
jgi:hypothetical protein